MVEVDEVEAASDGDSGSAWGAPAPIDGEGGLHRQMAFSAADVDGQWSYRIPLASASSGRPTVQVPQHGPSHKDLTINLTSTPPQRPRRRSWRRAGSSSRTNWGACEVQSTMVGEGISGRVGEYLRARGRRGGSTFPFSFLSTPRDNGTPFPPFFRDTFRSRCSLWRWEQACERWLSYIMKTFFSLLIFNTSSVEFAYLTPKGLVGVLNPVACSPFPPFHRASPGFWHQLCAPPGKDREHVGFLVRTLPAPHPGFRSTPVTSPPKSPFNFNIAPFQQLPSPTVPFPFTFGPFPSPLITASSL